MFCPIRLVNPYFFVCLLNLKYIPMNLLISFRLITKPFYSNPSNLFTTDAVFYCLKLLHFFKKYAAVFINKSFVCLLFCFVFTGVYSQEWKKVTKDDFLKQELKFRKSIPTVYTYYTLDFEQFKKNISGVSKGNKQTLTLPTADGIQKFSIQSASTFAIKLSDKFPMIRSYLGKGINNPSMTARFSLGTDGLHIVIYTSGQPSFYIDPFTKNNKTYIAYSSKELPRQDDEFKCLIQQQSKNKIKRSTFKKKSADDGTLRIFRLAVVSSGEFAQFHLINQGVSSTASETKKKAAVLSAINTTMTRVNGIFERDLGVRMEIVENNDEIIFLDSATDNITNGDSHLMIGEGQTICDSIIGNANYDIGHLFGTDGAGLAGLGVVCVEGSKGNGVTAIGNPIGDPFDIDYLSHEIGHQFGANHTQNNNCNENFDTAIEPGSGSTIMGYAGICAPNVQSISDDYFHAVSIDEMWNIIQSTANCATSIPTGNTRPTANAGLDYTVPKSTPLILKGIGEDNTPGDILTYSWEQIDPSLAIMPPLATNLQGPLFRSWPPSTSPDRYLPALETVIEGNTSSTWEVIPSVSREINFSLLVRDNHAGGGNSNRDDMKITIDETAGPFVVTSHTTSTISWDIGSSQLITWDVAGTDGGNINVSTVDILLSTDGGSTFPYTIAEEVPNIGSYNAVMPTNLPEDSTSARIMILANDNMFYAVNSKDFSITTSEFSFVIDTNIQNLCLPLNNSTYTFTYNTFLGFTGTTVFSISGLPSGITGNFNPASASTNGTSITLTLSGISNLESGNYSFNINGVSGNVTNQNIARLNILSDLFDPVLSNSPENGDIVYSLSPKLIWQIQSNAVSYDLEIALDENFTTIIESSNTTNNSYFIRSILNQETTYYWRVKPKNDCGEGTFSSVFSFTTYKCSVCTSSGNTNYETSITQVNFNSISHSSSKTTGYSDYRAIESIAEKGTQIPLTINVNTDGPYTLQTMVWIDWNQDCDFDDIGEEYNLGTTYNTSNGPTSLSPIEISVPLSAEIGNTVMRVSTKYQGQEGEVSSACEMNFDGEVEDYTVIVDLDSDFDGISNLLDLYPNTPLNEVVDIDGGLVLNSRDLSIITHSTTCPNTNTAKVSIQCSLPYLFDVTIHGDNYQKTFSGLDLQNGFEIDQLKAGHYSLNFDFTDDLGAPITGYQIILEDIDNITADKLNLNTKSRQVTYAIRGSNHYSIYINDSLYQNFEFPSVETQQIQIPLIQGENIIEIKGEKACQDSFKEAILLDGGMVVYPNPSFDFIYIEGAEGLVQIFNSAGVLMLEQQSTSKLKIEIQNLPQGIYHIKNIKTNSEIQIKRFLKE